jgi:hypothetical protein
MKKEEPFKKKSKENDLSGSALSRTFACGKHPEQI